MDNTKTLVPEIGTPLTRVDLKNLTGGLPFSSPALVIFSDSTSMCDTGYHCENGDTEEKNCSSGGTCIPGVHTNGGSQGPSKEKKEL